MEDQEIIKNLRLDPEESRELNKLHNKAVLELYDKTIQIIKNLIYSRFSIFKGDIDTVARSIFTEALVRMVKYIKVRPNLQINTLIGLFMRFCERCLQEQTRKKIAKKEVYIEEKENFQLQGDELHLEEQIDDGQLVPSLALFIELKSKMGEKCRKLLELTFDTEKTLERRDDGQEIAESLGLTHRVYRARLHRCYNKLRTLLDEKNKAKK